MFLNTFITTLINTTFLAVTLIAEGMAEERGESIFYAVLLCLTDQKPYWPQAGQKYASTVLVSAVEYTTTAQQNLIFSSLSLSHTASFFISIVAQGALGWPKLNWQASALCQLLKSWVTAERGRGPASRISPLIGPLLGGVIGSDDLRLGEHSVLILWECVAVCKQDPENMHQINTLN